MVEHGHAAIVSDGFRRDRARRGWCRGGFVFLAAGQRQQGQCGEKERYQKGRRGFPHHICFLEKMTAASASGPAIQAASTPSRTGAPNWTWLASPAVPANRLTFLKPVRLNRR